MDMKWNYLDGKCYYINDEKLYRIGGEGSRSQLMKDRINNYFTYVSGDIRDCISVKSTDESGTSYVVLYDEVLPIN